MNDQELASRPQQVPGAMMSEEEIAFLRDVQGMIDFAIRNGLTFGAAFNVLLHDLIEIRQEKGDLRQAKARGFVPKVMGYASITPESFGGEDNPVD
jgi:hypothetical protein